MANLRFHEKYHGTLHHTVSSVEYPGSATDPIASKARPFVGNFHLNAALSASGGMVLNGRLGLGNPTDGTGLTLDEMTKLDFANSAPAGVLTLPGSSRFNDGICFGGNAGDAYNVSYINRIHNGGNMHGASGFGAHVRVWKHMTVPGHMHIGIAGHATDPRQSHDLDIFSGCRPTLGVKAQSSDYAVGIEGNPAGGHSHGLRILAGSNPSDAGLSVVSTTGTGGKSRLYVRGDGLIGVGTNSPSYRMHIKHDDDNQVLRLQSVHGPRLQFQDDETDKRWSIHAGGSNTDLNFTCTDRSVDVFRMTRTGLVAFGATYPAAPLHIYSYNGDLRDCELLLEHGRTGSVYKTKVSFKNASGTESIYKYNSERKLRFDVAGAQRMCIDNSGNILVGSSNASRGAALDVHKPFVPTFMQLSVGSDNTTDDRAGVSFLDAVGGRHAYIYSDKGSGFYLANDDNLPMIFYTNGGERMRIGKDEGNVTIGSGDPTAGYRLEVKPGATGGILVDGTGSRFYAIDLKRSGNFLTSPDIYDANGSGLVLGHNGSSADITMNSTGVGIKKICGANTALDIQGNVKISGNLDVSGDTTMASASSSMVIQDPVIDIGAESGSSNDSYDRGIRFAYGTGSAALSGFFGWDRTENKFVVIPDASFTANGNNATGTYGGVKAGTFEATSNINAPAGNINSFTGMTMTASSKVVSPTVEVTTINPEDGSTTTKLGAANLYLRNTSAPSNTKVIVGSNTASGNSMFEVAGTGQFAGTLNAKSYVVTGGGGGFSPSSNALFGVFNGGSDRELRLANPGEARTALGLSDAATTSIAEIRASCLPIGGGIVHGDVFWRKTGTAVSDWLRVYNTAKSLELYAPSSSQGLFISANTSTGPSYSPKIQLNPRLGNHNEGWFMRVYGSSTLGDSHLEFVQGQGGSPNAGWNTRLSIRKSAIYYNNYEMWHKGNFDPMAYGVVSFNGRVKHVTLTRADIDNAAGGKVWSANNDGSGSGSDADRVDGLHAASFLRSDAHDICQKGWDWTTGPSHCHAATSLQPFSHYGMYREGIHSGDNPYRTVKDGFHGPGAEHAKLAINWHRGINIRSNPHYGGVQFYGDTYNHSNTSNLLFSVGRGSKDVRVHTGNLYIQGNTAWHAGNDGTGSGLDADKIQGITGSDVVKITKHAWDDAPGQDANTQPRQSISFSYSNNCPWNGPLINIGKTNYTLQLNSLYYGDGSGLSFRTHNGDSGKWNPWYKIYHSGNLTNVSQLNNDTNYIKSSVGQMTFDQDLSKSREPSFAAVHTTDQSKESKFANAIFVQNGKELYLGNNSSTRRFGMNVDGNGNTFFSTYGNRNWMRDVRIQGSTNGYIGIGSSNASSQRKADPVYSTHGPRAPLHIFRGGMPGLSNESGNDAREVLRLQAHTDSDLQTGQFSTGGYISLAVTDNNTYTVDNGGEKVRLGWYADNGDNDERSGGFRIHTMLKAGWRERLRINKQGHASFHNTDYFSVKGTSGSENAAHIGWTGDNGYPGFSHESRRGQSGKYAIRQRNDGYTQINSGAHYLAFCFNGALKMALHSDGSFMIGHGGGKSSHKLDVNGTIRSRSTGYFDGDVIAYYSDRRLKNNFNQITDYKEILDGLTGYRFNWNESAKGIVPDENHGEDQVGLIAQEVEEVLPEAVHTWKHNDYKTIKYDKLVPVLVEALKAEMQKTNDLEARLKRLEQLIDDK